MTKKKIVTWLVIILTCTILVYMINNNPFKTSDYDVWSEEVSYQDYVSAVELLENSKYRIRNPYISYLEDSNHTLDYNVNNITNITLVSEASNNCYNYSGNACVNLADTTNAIYKVNVPKAGMYNIEFDYVVLAGVLNNLTLSIKINDETPFEEAKTIDVPLFWKDDSKQFSLDTYGDESLPTQLRVVEWRPLELFDNTYMTSEPLYFYLEEGENTIEVINVQGGDLQIKDMRVLAPKQYESYESYISKYANVASPKTEITVDAINYTEKNTSYVRLMAYQTPSVEPYNSVDKKLNVIDGAAWNKAGQEVKFEISKNEGAQTLYVEEDGLYLISFHYLNTKDQFSVFRTIKIDGEVPFKELVAYEFPATSSSKWQNITLGDGENDYKIYLTKGVHTLSMKAEKSPMNTELKNIQLLVDHINQFSLEVKKIVGGDIDKDKTWTFTSTIPETESYLKAYDTIIKYIVLSLSDYSSKGDLSATISYLKTSINKLEKISEYPDKLPIYLDMLYSGTGSITQMLGDTIDKLNSNPLYLDSFTVYNEDLSVSENASMFVKAFYSIKTFFVSFTTNKYQAKNDPEAINVWVNRPLTYVDMIQKLTDATFTKETGIKVKISIMPDSNKLILANAANKTPDVALGLASYMPFDFAIRGAVVNLAELPGFWEFANEFAPGCFVSSILEDGVYGFPETLDFHALVYRKDVFTKYNLQVPDNWDDVIGLLASLQSYDMNFYYPTSGGSSLKWFYQTSPLIYQYGGSIYSEDGLTTTIDDEKAYQGIKLLGDLYTTYSLPAQVVSFYNSFRYNKLPVGIIDFGTYLTLKNAAPELTGQWGLSLYPGVVDENGETQRWYIAAGSSAVIFKSSSAKDQEQRKLDSWKFLKWWLSAETQTNFAFSLQSTYGPEYVWLSSNLNAVKNSPIDSEDKAVILEMITWLVDIPRTPGQYMLERGLSDIWNKMTFDGVSARIAIDNQVLKINREIKKKMIEFGYVDEKGNVLVPYTVRDVEWVKEQMAKAMED